MQRSAPEFKRGDRAWFGAPIADLPDLSSVRLGCRVDEADRARLQLDSAVRVRVDAIPDKEFIAELDWISPIAAVVMRGMGQTDKSFPARATLNNLDARLRPGMSASTDIIIESQPNCILIPIRASFLDKGKPAVYVQRGQDFQIRPIEVGKRNETDLVVLKGLREGEIIAQENPIEAAKRAKKL